MKWVSRCKLPTGIELDKNLSPIFNDVHECIKFIENNLQDLEQLLSKTQHFLDFNIDKKLIFRFGSYVRAYNLTLHRWVDGFDL